MEKLNRFLGIRPREAKTVWLFFAHNFLLGLGTVLAFVAANVVLLHDQPMRNLPLGYCAGALAVLVVGRVYAYFEEQLLLKKLAGRALLVAIVLVLGLGLLWWYAPSVGAAVAIMAGYRVAYLLVNLQIWGVASASFNARQGRRLFNVISSGDIVGKGLGALLLVLLHRYLGLSALLLAAFGAFLGAWRMQQFTLQAQSAARIKSSYTGRPLPKSLLQHGFGRNQLIRAMGFSLAALAAVTVCVEYFLFMSVYNRLPLQPSIVETVGGVLALTYLLALVGKVVLARYGLDRLGVRGALAGLPLAGLAGVLLAGALTALRSGFAARMLFFCGFYLVLESLRRALFEPIFQTLYQPLKPRERVESHTLIKGFYEPLGLGLSGLLLFGLRQMPALSQWVPLVWMALLLLGALYLVKHAYRNYLEGLKGALGLRFLENAPSATETDEPGQHPDEEALDAIEHLQRAGSGALAEHAENLLNHADSRVRNRVLRLVGHHADPTLLRRLALDDPNPVLREMASRLVGRHPQADDLLQHPDLVVRKGALIGRLEDQPADALAQTSLEALLASTDPDTQLLALALIRFLIPEQQLALVTTSLHSPDPTLVQAAVHAVAETPTPTLIAQLIALVSDKKVRKPAAECLVRLGDAALPLLKEALLQETDEQCSRRLAQVCASPTTPAARQVLVDVVQGANLHGRAAALLALAHFPSSHEDSPVFQRLVEKELRMAKHLLHGMVAANAELRSALHFELRGCRRRLFGLLLQMYERQYIVEARRGVEHSTGELQLTALEILDNLIPRPLYQGLQALLDVGRLSHKVQLLEGILGPSLSSEPIHTTIVRRGAAGFSSWTISVALRQWHAQPNTVEYLYPLLQSPNLLIQESACAVLRQLPMQRPAAFDHLVSVYPCVNQMLMSNQANGPSYSAQERIRMLKGTPLFAETSENVLATIMPIMKEVAFQPGQEIFAKGAIGTTLFIVGDGEVGIFDGKRQLTTFRKGDFFGELALLDAQARSASAVALGPVVAFRIDQEDFYDVMEECAEVVRNIMRVLCQRLRQQNDKM
ncbi:cyclic nucleotide-binding domain-containing protein [Hymenobacter sp. BT491]|uniref:cyclic nucleotide-binding domain-containing protein n=1 Tax=Hymenobacter sp. BT491 TaxID=2766779 RepID=UPI001653794E|nr:cyclic nucleotide-binding domain-containing protein [Hymenobacter sp. BT491]MBC6988771.1 cyclic nucleotide-binding domain-containing protein [Hymenobacter sp. BT491]